MNTSPAALQFEIIKRLSPGFRHRMLGKMQPIALLSQLIGKKIQAGQKESEFLLERLQELKESLHLATHATIGLFSWLNPDEEEVQPLNEIIDECLDLLKMDIYASNVVFRNQLTITKPVKASQVRNMFAGCVLTYIDTIEKPAEVIISATQDDEGKLCIQISHMPLTDKPIKEMSPRRSFLDWQHIALLSGGAEFSKDEDQALISNIT